MAKKKDKSKSKSPPKMVTLRAMIDDAGVRKMVVPAKDADKTIAKCFQVGFKEKMTHSTRPYRVHAPGTIRHIDIEPIP